MPLDNTEMAAALAVPAGNVSKFHRIIITAQRITKRNAEGVATERVTETINLVHPDDPARHPPRSDWHDPINGFRALGQMFKGNPNYQNVTYTKTEAFI